MRDRDCPQNPFSSDAIISLMSILCTLIAAFASIGGELSGRKLVWIFVALVLGTTCTAIANLLTFEIFNRLESLGHLRRWWRMEDYKLLRLYWKLAPDHGWPRSPLIAAVGLMLIAFAALLLATFGS